MYLILDISESACLLVGLRPRGLLALDYVADSGRLGLGRLTFLAWGFCISTFDCLVAGIVYNRGTPFAAGYVGLLWGTYRLLDGELKASQRRKIL